MPVIEDILAEIKEDADVKDLRIGTFWTIVWSRHCGLASTIFEHEHSSGPPVRAAGNLCNISALELCNYYNSPSILERSIALAAINSLIDVSAESCENINASNLLFEHGKDKKVCVVGHFPFLPDLQKVTEELWVLERRPRLGDLPAAKARDIIPKADVVAITGTALINGTMDNLLELCRKDAKVMILGPTTPLTKKWFKYNVDIISGTVVTNPELAVRLVSEGIIFSQFKGRAVKLYSMTRDACR